MLLGLIQTILMASLVLSDGWPGCVNGSADSLGQWSKSFIIQQLFVEENNFLSKSYSNQPSWKVIVNFLRPGLSAAKSPVTSRKTNLSSSVYLHWHVYNFR